MSAYDFSGPDAPREELRRPAGWRWILFTFFAAYVLNIATMSGELMWTPDFIAVMLVYWCIWQPRSVGMFAAFACGLLMDVLNGSVLGQQALAYVTLAYLAYWLHRRVPWFGPVGQALHVLPLLFIAHLTVLVVRLWLDNILPEPMWFLQPVTGALIWPLWSYALQTSQRRSART